MAEAISHSLVQTLRAVPGFARADDPTLLRVVGTSANLRWSGGSTIFAHGDPAEALYIVLSGAVRIARPGGSDGDEEVARYGPGDYFGEHSLLLRTSHSRTAVAAEDSELMVITTDAFTPLLEDHPELAAHFREQVSARDAT